MDEQNKTITDIILEIQELKPHIEKDGKNDYHKSTYATLPNVINTLYPLLTERKTIVLYEVRELENHVTLLHVPSKTFKDTYIPLVGVTDMQKLGSALTYSQRYGLLTILGLAADIDDDANTAAADVEVKEKKQESNVKLNIEKLKKLLVDKRDKLTDDYFNKFTERLKENDPEKLIKIQIYLENL